MENELFKKKRMINYMIINTKETKRTGFKATRNMKIINKQQINKNSNSNKQTCKQKHTIKKDK